MTCGQGDLIAQRERKEISVNKTVSLPLSLVNKVAEVAERDGTDYSTTTVRLVKLGLVYQKMLADQSAIEDAEYLNKLREGTAKT